MSSKLHLDRLTVKNFRALDDLTLEGLGRVNVLVGRNNSGKSTILDAVELLVGSNKIGVLSEQALRHGEIEEKEKKTLDSDFTFLENFFSGRQLPKEFGSINLGSTLDSVVLSHYFVQEIALEEDDNDNESIRIPRVRRKLVETLDDAEDESGFYRAIALSVNGKRSVLADNEDNENKYVSIRRLFNQTESSKDLIVRYVTTKSLPNTYLDNLWSGGIQFDEDLKSTLNSALKLLSDDVESFGFAQVNPSDKERKALVKLKDFDKPVPLSSMGDGMSRVLHIVLSLLNAKDGVLLIDEMENGLHYRIQENLWRIIFEFSTKLNIQVFVTTHSWDVIESFSKISIEHPEEGVLYRLGRSIVDGKLNPYRYSEERLYQVTQSEMEVR